MLRAATHTWLKSIHNFLGAAYHTLAVPIEASLVESGLVPCPSRPACKVNLGLPAEELMKKEKVWKMEESVGIWGLGESEMQKGGRCLYESAPYWAAAAARPACWGSALGHVVVVAVAVAVCGLHGLKRRYLHPFLHFGDEDKECNSHCTVQFRGQDPRLLLLL